MPKAYALTTKARVKTFLGISGTNSDAILDILIDQATSFIETYCGRRFQQSTYTNEVYDSDGSGIIFLKNVPISSVTSVQVRNSALNEDEWETVDTELYRLDTDSNAVKGMSNYRFQKGRGQLRVSYIGGYSFDNVNTFLSETDAGDVEYACWKLVATMFNNRKGSAGVQSESIGDYSVTMRKAVFEDPELLGILDQYAHLGFAGGLTPSHSDSGATGGF